MSKSKQEISEIGKVDGIGATDSEKLDKIKCIACTGDEFIKGFAKVEQIRAIIACVESYCENCLEGEPHHYITAMLRLMNDVTDELEKYFSEGIQVIIDIAAGKDMACSVKGEDIVYEG